MSFITAIQYHTATYSDHWKGIHHKGYGVNYPLGKLGKLGSQ